MIHPGTPTGRNIVRGSMIPGLRYVERDTLHLFAVDGDGHEWYTLLEAEDLESALWEHAPTTCDKCLTRNVNDRQRIDNLPHRGGDFNRPMGVKIAERDR